MANDVTSRAHALQEYIKQGKILEAMSEFYDASIAMQENRKPAVVGLQVNIEREKQFLSQVKQFKGYEVKSLAIGGDVSAVESVMEFTNQQDQPVRLEQVSIQRWKNGKIVHERFYYDSAA
jgi:protein tyrosine phosphatase